MGVIGMRWQVTEQGSRAVIDVWRENDGAGLYKAYISGSTGRFPLGALLPEGDGLHLRRAVSVDDLKSRGAWPICRVEEELVCSFAKQPEPICWRDDILCQCARRLPRHTVQRSGEITTFVFPFDTRCPLPFVPVFCFARVENGRLIFSFHRDGSPVYFPHGWKK